MSIAVTFLIYIYYAAQRMFDNPTALFAVVLISFQQMYFFQSSFVMIELFLAFCGFVALYSYLQKQYSVSIFFLSVLFLTKESGIILGIIIAGDIALSMLSDLRNKENFKKLLFIIPFLIITSFFILQKYINGWYVLPLYTDEINTTLSTFNNKFKSCITVIFIDEYRKVYFSALVILLLYNTRKIIPKIVLAILTITIIYYHKAFIDNNIINTVISLIFSTSFLYFCYNISSYIYNATHSQIRFIKVFGFFFLLFSYFSAYNLFFIDRYLLIILVPCLFISAGIMINIVQELKPKWYYATLVSLIVVESVSFYRAKGVHPFDGLDIHTQVAHEIEKSFDVNTSIAAGGYLERVHLTDTNTQFLIHKKPFTKVDWVIDEQTQVIIFDNIESDSRYNNFNTNKQYVLFKRFENKTAWAEIYILK